MAKTAMSVGAGAAGGRRVPLVAFKDVCWLLYLYPVRWFARLFPRVCLAMEGPITLVALVLGHGVRRHVEGKMEQSGQPRIASNARHWTKRLVRNRVSELLSDLTLDTTVAGMRDDQIEWQGLEHLEAAQSAGRGALLVSGHFFGSRLAKRKLVEMGHPITAVRSLKIDDRRAGQLGRRLKPRYLEFLQTLIGDQIDIRQPNSMLEILKRLRQGGLIQTMVDARFTTNPVRTTFLGREFDGSTAVFRIAARTGAPILPFWYRGTLSQLKVEIGPPLQWNTELPEHALQQVLHQLEQRVVESPDLYYMWERWR